ncbi:MAG: peptidylprolyl isomerase [Halothiobacillaceae bacterium]|nr:peptidylprolyl isomerase [Halothiobacillaceae bacterium]MDY0049244.1 peptidylprolyl isomerase [Halothiobacillaceae bacterium]
MRPVIRNTLAALVLFSGPLFSVPASAQLVDQVVAVVNDDVITGRELDLEIRTVVQQLRARDPNLQLPPPRVLQAQVLDRMIGQRAQLQLASQLGIRIDDITLNGALENIAAQNGMTLPQFRDTLEKQGVSFPVFREQIRNEITLQRLHQREVVDRVIVSDREVDEYLERFTGGAAGTRNEYHLQNILIPLPETASPDDISAARALGEEALKALQSEDFAAVAARYSKAPNALEGGELGWRDASRVPSLLLDTVTQLQAGQHSGLIRGPNGFHIVRVAEIRGVQEAPKLTETHARHILIQTDARTSNDDARRQVEALRERAQKGADFAELARTYSADKGSAERGGDLGWVRPGVMVEEFERAMNETPSGALSPAFRSPFGWHVIQVLERRETTPSMEQLRSQARQAVGQRKSEEDLFRWTQRIRSEAYIENRIPAP